MHEHGKSDRPIVPRKSPNKTKTPAAEEMEGRGLAKGNLSQLRAGPMRPVRWHRYDKRQKRTRM